MIDSKTVKKVEEADPRGVRFMNSLKGNDTSQFSAKEKPQVRLFLKKNSGDGLSFMQWLHGGTILALILGTIGIIVAI
ncbi:hypothetical protein F441_02881 [Phytophthora nicotianae CJ01A1]|uniref:Uncharacterized protein n=3 Tax=Phytophthora nicotianae TaxID=4792 RepID=W2LT56_PHYNI|nr:hypothetical protein L915_02781 [Phytophthora nicotianae]ETM00608.1 hypothetical protein L917_02688 [Phytophthora nicotianae]ETO83002.1 hypothetical protein F444_02916 [Phytophthora nicotianae P1976]ETP24078.1 hypothetical protein F441_02881 [Phytophthora nicotianae CJ01A1]